MARQKSNLENRGEKLDLVSVASRHLNTMGVSVEWFGAIAAELGVSRPALYNYVVDRDDLLFKCYAKACDRLDDCLRIAIEGAQSPADVLQRFLIETTRPDAPEQAVLSEIGALPPDLQAVIEARRDAVVSGLATAIRLGIRQGQFRAVDPIIIANTVIGLSTWPILFRRWASNATVAPDAEGMIEILFRGLATDRTFVFDESKDLLPPLPGKVDLFDRRALDQAKREAILVHASDLFNRRGIGATRVEDVGAAVGLSKRAIFHHIGNKAALVDACVDRAIKFYLDVMEAADRMHGSRLETYAVGMKTGVQAAGDPARSILVPYVGFGLLSARSQQAMLAFSQTLTEGYRKVFNDGQREGSIRPLPREEVLASMPGLFSWVSTSPFGADHNRSRVARELANLVALGILADGAP